MCRYYHYVYYHGIGTCVLFGGRETRPPQKDKTMPHKTSKQHSNIIIIIGVGTLSVLYLKKPTTAYRLDIIRQRPKGTSSLLYTGDFPSTSPTIILLSQNRTDFKILNSIFKQLPESNKLLPQYNNSTYLNTVES